MSKIAIVTDSNSGITRRKDADLECLLFLCLFINEKMYLEGITRARMNFISG